MVGSALCRSGLDEAVEGGSRVAPRALSPSLYLPLRYPYLKRELTSEASDGKRVGRGKAEEEGRHRVVDKTRNPPFTPSNRQAS